ncbi:MAG: ABC transporter permease [Nitrososphaerales archaeon]|nr:ABC transporter permease [Nitrososphaerales archaeon]
MPSYLKFLRVSGLAWKVWMRNRDVFMKTYKVNFILPLLEPILYLLALGFGLGLYIGTIDGTPYAVFIAPGLISISIMNSAFFECTYGSYVRMYYQKTFDAIVATPLNLDEVITGEILWGATRSLINASLMLMVIIAFGLVSLPTALIIIPFSFLAGFLFSTIAMCFIAVSPTIDSLNYPIFLLITPMFLFSGTFFPISILPQPIQYISIASLPLVHVVEISRALTMSRWDELLLFNLVWITIVSIVFFVLSVNLMKRRLIS